MLAPGTGGLVTRGWLCLCRRFCQMQGSRPEPPAPLPTLPRPPLPASGRIRGDYEGRGFLLAPGGRQQTSVSPDARPSLPSPLPACSAASHSCLSSLFCFLSIPLFLTCPPLPRFPFPFLPVAVFLRFLSLTPLSSPPARSPGACFPLHPDAQRGEWRGKQGTPSMGQPQPSGAGRRPLSTAPAAPLTAGRGLFCGRLAVKGPLGSCFPGIRHHRASLSMVPAPGRAPCSPQPGCRLILGHLLDPSHRRGPGPGQRGAAALREAAPGAGAAGCAGAARGPGLPEAGRVRPQGPHGHPGAQPPDPLQAQEVSEAARLGAARGRVAGPRGPGRAGR